jgi:hypothetical protein
MSDNLNFERLEDRRLLAVSVTTGKQGLLKITSDGGSDFVEVDGTGVFGEVDVYVGGSFAGTFSGVKTIKAAMKGGEDSLHVSAIQIGGALDVNMGAGPDIFDLDTEAVGGEGAPFFGDVFIGGAVIAKLGNNTDDFVEWDTNVAGEGFGITIGNNVTLQGAADVDLDGAGEDFGVQDTDINIGGFLRITSNIAGDVNGDGHNVDLDDINVGGTTIIALGAADDDIQVTDSSFARRVEASLGAGDDLIDSDEGPGNQNRFDGVVVVNGGNGTDEVDGNPLDEFAFFPPTLNSVEIS